jgi:SAM-dependent methyltransferase
MRLTQGGETIPLPVRRPDKHVLYEAAVQDVDFDLLFFQRVYRSVRGRPFARLREDFCGSARIACSWVTRGRDHHAWAVDLDAATLDWTRRHHVAHLGRAATRLHLVHADVRHARVPKVDVIAALNCSYWTFQRRRDLIGYLRAARGALRPDGLLFLDGFGGEGAAKPLVERRVVRGQRGFDGERVPPFGYVWEQRSFNPVNHHLLCHIHFHLADGRQLRRAFTYDWRMWTLPELDDALREAGFRDVRVYVQGWDDDAHQPLHVYRRRRRFENQEAWLAYIVGVK